MAYHYRISYLNRYGINQHIELTLPYLIMRDAQGDLCLFDQQRCIGSEQMLEHMIRQKGGFDEAISIISAHPF